VKSLRWQALGALLLACFFLTYLVIRFWSRF